MVSVIVLLPAVECTTWNALIPADRACFPVVRDEGKVAEVVH